MSNLEAFVLFPAWCCFAICPMTSKPFKEEVRDRIEPQTSHPKGVLLMRVERDASKTKPSKTACMVDFQLKDRTRHSRATSSLDIGL